MRRTQFDLDQQVKRELTSKLDQLARYNKAGALTQTSKNDIRRALGRAGRANAQSNAGKDTNKQIGKHLDRMERVSKREFQNQLTQLADSPGQAKGLFARAKEKFTDTRARGTATTRNRKLAADVRKQHLDRTADDVIAIMSGQPPHSKLTQAQRLERARGRVAEISKLTQNRVDRIAAFETDTINTEMAQRLSAAAGIKSYRWITQGDEHVRDEHVLRENKVYLWSHAHDDGHPGEPPNCRCTAEPVLAAA